MALNPLGVLASGQDINLARSVSLTFAAGVDAGTLCVLTAASDLSSSNAATVTDPWGNTWTQHLTTTAGGHATLYRAVLTHAIPAGGSWTWPDTARVVDVQGFTGLSTTAPLNSPPADIELVGISPGAFEQGGGASQIFLPTHLPVPLTGQSIPSSIGGYGFGITDGASYLACYFLWCKASINQAVTTPTLTLPAGWTQGSLIRNPGTGNTNGTVFVLQTAYRLWTGPIAAPTITCAGGTITYDNWTTVQTGIALIGPPDATPPPPDPDPAPPTGPPDFPPTGSGTQAGPLALGGECDHAGGTSTSTGENCPGGVSTWTADHTTGGASTDTGKL